MYTIRETVHRSVHWQRSMKLHNELVRALTVCTESSSCIGDVYSAVRALCTNSRHCRFICAFTYSVPCRCTVKCTMLVNCILHTMCTIQCTYSTQHTSSAHYSVQSSWCVYWEPAAPLRAFILHSTCIVRCSEYCTSGIPFRALILYSALAKCTYIVHCRLNVDR